MEGENRSTPGDRLVSRILTRVHRRPRMGLSPDFYARFGMEDPWNAPSIGGEAPAEGDGFVFLSAQPYYAMLRRLAAARKRREKRHASFTERRAGTQLRAARRSWPGETAASLAVSRIARIALDDMTLPPAQKPVAAPVQIEQGGVAAPAQPARRGGTTRTNRGASAWWSTPFIPARVFGGSSVVASEDAGEVGDERGATGAARAAAPVRAPRIAAASHAGARLAAAASRSGSAARAIEDAVPAALVGARRQAVARIASVIDTLPPEQQAEEIRRVVRRLGASSPIVRTVYEDAPATRPAQIASRRADPASTAGLRPVLSRSPAMALAAAPDLDRAASGTLATAERSEASRGLTATPRRASAARRALSRGAAAAPGASSVPAPVGYARASVTAALSAPPLRQAGAARGSESRSAAPAPRAGSSASSASAAYAPVASEFGPSSTAGLRRAAPRLRASARAVARFADAPLADVLPALIAAPAQAAVRSASGTWIPAALSAPGERPTVAVRRSPGTSHAAARVEAGQVEGRSVLPRPIPSAPDRVLASLPLPPAESTAAALAATPAAVSSRTRALSASPVSRAAGAMPTLSSPVRTADGAFVPARTLASSGARTASGASFVRGSAGEWASARAAEPTGTPGQGEGPASPSFDPLTRASRSPTGSPPVQAARTLAPTEFRTATPQVGTPAEAAAPTERFVAPRAAAAAASRAQANLAAASSAAARSSVVHAAARADVPSETPAAEGRAVASRALALRSVGDSTTRASSARAPSMAHASARVDLPVEAEGLQPRIAPSRSVVRARPAAASASNPTRSAARSAARSARAPSVAAAERVLASPLLAASAARALADTVAPAAAAPRFARSGPLAWALPALAPAAAAPPLTAGEPAPTGRSGRRERVVRAWSANAVPPTSAVAAPGGVYMSASAAARVPGVRLLRTEAGRLVAVVAESGAAPTRGPAAQTRGPSNARLAATSGVAFAQPFGQPSVSPVDADTEALVAPAAPARRRAAAWAADRTQVADATAYRGAFRAPDSTVAAGQTFTTANGEFEGARVSRTPARRERPRRVSATAGEMAYATPAAAPIGASAQETSAGTSRRQPLEERLHGVAVGQPGGPAAPTWAARSDGTPMVRSPGGLFEALAKASTAEDIVRVIYARAEGVRETPLAQEAPVVQVIEQIRQEVRREQAATVEATRASRLDAPSATVIRGQYVTPVASTTRVRRGGVRGVNATARAMGAGSGDDRIMKLVKKLQGLIHLAEMEGRLADARSQVRLAEDSAGARAEGQGPVGASKETGEKREKQDIDALGREVLEVVSREMELRRMRRLEDHDESVWW